MARAHVEVVVAAGEVLRTSKEVARQRGLERLARGLVVQAASAHGVEDVKVAGLRASKRWVSCVLVNGRVWADGFW